MPLQLGVALLILASVWLGLRRTVAAPLRGTPMRLLVLDAWPVATGWALLLALTGRPVLAAIVLAACGIGLACGDRAKRNATGEPLVFTDGVLGSIFLYPSLYAEFVTPPMLVFIALVTAAAVCAAGALEPPLWSHAWPGSLIAAALVWAAIRTGRSRRLTLVAGAAPEGDAARDAAVFGPLAAVAIHTAVASSERAARRRNRTPGCSDCLPVVDAPSGPIVLLQLESFFDARRMGAFVPPGLLPCVDRCKAWSTRHGRLLTPAYGANTVRTEFAALTGLPDEAIGLDRFNPYAAFARVPIDSIAWRLKAAGYRTICIHPFAGRFYGRDRVMPNLGFDVFMDIASFGPIPARGGYVADSVLVGRIAELLAEHGRKTFVFAITMGNHSPWQPAPAGPNWPMPQSAAFAGFLDGLRRTDAAVGDMADVMRQSWRDGLLGVFGDHQPSFPQLYQHVGFTDRRTDYFFYRPDQASSQISDIAAHQLPGLLLQDAAGPIAKRPLLTLAAGN